MARWDSEPGECELSIHATADGNLEAGEGSEPENPREDDLASVAMSETRPPIQPRPRLLCCCSCHDSCSPRRR